MPQRIAVVGNGPAALSATERLIAAGMCVDLLSPSPAPFGLLRRFAGLRGCAADCVGRAAKDVRCAPGTTPRLRLIGNVRVSDEPGADLTPRELHALSSHPDPQVLILELLARGVPVTTWEGLCRPVEDFADWNAIVHRAQLAHVSI